MSWTAADLANLETALASGVLEVRYDGPPMRLQRYQSTAEMRELRKDMLREIAASSGASVTYRLASHSKGL